MEHCVHVKINHIEFEEKFLIKTTVRRLIKEFSDKQGKKRTLSDFLQTVGTICSTACTAVSGCFCAIFSFAR